MISFPFGIYAIVLDHIVILFLALWALAMLFSTMTLLILIYINNIQRVPLFLPTFLILCSYDNSHYLHFRDFEKCWLLLVYLLAILMTSSEKHLFTSLAYVYLDRLFWNFLCSFVVNESFWFPYKLWREISCQILDQMSSPILSDYWLFSLL